MKYPHARKLAAPRGGALSGLRRPGAAEMNCPRARKLAAPRGGAVSGLGPSAAEMTPPMLARSLPRVGAP
jgi:hypothetical protein